MMRMRGRGESGGKVRKTTFHELAAPVTDKRMALLELVLKLEGVPLFEYSGCARKATSFRIAPTW
jgi:hypothetical protein